MTDSAAVAACLSAVVADFGRLDIAHNNAGVPGVFADTADYPPAVWQRVLAVNLTGVFHCLQAERSPPLADTRPPGSRPFARSLRSLDSGLGCGRRRMT